MTSRDRILANKELVMFLTKFSENLEEQLNTAGDIVRETVDSVMNDIVNLTESSDQSKARAEKTLEDTYFRPDHETNDLVASIQNAVDDVFDQAVKSGTPNTKENIKEIVDDSNNARLRRTAGKFSKEVESLSTFSDEVKKILMPMIGALSNDDVIMQRVEHITTSIHALHVMLGYVLVDIDNRLNINEIDSLIDKLLDFTLNQYSMEDERRVFRTVFPQFEPVKKKAG